MFQTPAIAMALDREFLLPIVPIHPEKTCSTQGSSYFNCNTQPHMSCLGEYLQGPDWPHQSSPNPQFPFINLKLKLCSSSTLKDKHHHHPPRSTSTGSFPFYPHRSINSFPFFSSLTNHFHVVVILVQVLQHQLSCLSQSSYHASVFCSWSEISLLTSSIKHGVQRSNNLWVSSKQCS